MPSSVSEPRVRISCQCTKQTQSDRVARLLNLTHSLGPGEKVSNLDGVERWGRKPHFVHLTAIGYRPMSADNTTPQSSSSRPPEIDDQTAEALEAVAEARQRLGQVPASVVVANHAMGLFELAAIHLGSEPPNLPEAQLAIDALGYLIDGLGPRIGEHHDTLVAALGNIRLVYVQRSEKKN